MALLPFSRAKARLAGRILFALACAAPLFTGARLSAEDGSVHGLVRILHRAEGESGSGDVVVWLTPVRGGRRVSAGAIARLTQKNKTFSPHVVAVTQGTEIEFPNHDLFFHNVSSIHQGKTFDLGLYESGAARRVRFNQAGVTHIFCNIHPEMSAVVMVLGTRYFAVSGEEGRFQINRVPPGRYKLAVWYEQTAEAELQSQARELEVIPGSNEISLITLHSVDAPKEHPNKDGEGHPTDEMKSR
jgi:plastocyanin